MSILRTAFVILTMTFGLTTLWGHHPRALPAPPEWVINFLVQAYEPENAEELDDLELLYSLVVCFAFSCSAVLVVDALKKRFG